LKKQSQLSCTKNGVTSYVKVYYGNIQAGKAEENKAIQSQFRQDWPTYQKN